MSSMPACPFQESYQRSGIAMPHEIEALAEHLARSRWIMNDKQWGAYRDDHRLTGVYTGLSTYPSKRVQCISVLSLHGEEAKDMQDGKHAPSTEVCDLASIVHADAIQCLQVFQCPCVRRTVIRKSQSLRLKVKGLQRTKQSALRDRQTRRHRYDL